MGLHAAVRCLMTQPVQHLRTGLNLAPAGHDGTLDHDDRDLQCARGVNLGPRRRPPGILGHDHLNPVIPQKREVGLVPKRTAVENNVMVRQVWRDLRGVDQTQQIVMLWLRRKGRKVQTPQGQHDALRRGAKSVNGLRNICHSRPKITSLLHPGRSGQRDQWRSRCSTSLRGVAAHLCGEGMGRVNHMGGVAFAQKPNQTVNSAKSAYAGRKWLSLGAGHAPGIGKDTLFARSSQIMRQGRAIGGSAQNEKVALDG